METCLGNQESWSLGLASCHALAICNFYQYRHVTLLKQTNSPQHLEQLVSICIHFGGFVFVNTSTD